jgi:hypothetical protein
MQISGSLVPGLVVSANIGAVNCDRGTFYNIKLIKTSSAVLELLLYVYMRRERMANLEPEVGVAEG